MISPYATSKSLTIINLNSLHPFLVALYLTQYLKPCSPPRSHRPCPRPLLIEDFAPPSQSTWKRSFTTLSPRYVFWSIPDHLPGPSRSKLHWCFLCRTYIPLDDWTRYISFVLQSPLPNLQSLVSPIIMRPFMKSSRWFYSWLVIHIFIRIQCSPTIAQLSLFIENIDFSFFIDMVKEADHYIPSNTTQHLWCFVDNLLSCQVTFR